MSAGAERIELRRIAPQPWKNGAGLTRELALGPAGATTADFDWRVSVAEVTRDAPFSPFPDIERSIVLLQGAGLRLRFANRTHWLDAPFAPFRFSGDEPLDSELIDGPTVDFNLMLHRGRCCAAIHHGEHVDAPAGAPVGLLLSWGGAAAVQPTHGGTSLSLDAGEALLWRDRMPALRARALTPFGRLLLVCIEPLCQDGLR